MITGVVDANLEATIHLYVEDAIGQPHRVEAIVDTGFSEFLSLPKAQLAALTLP